MAPFAHTYEWSTWTVYIVSFIIGIGFGAVLEMSGFGDSRKLTGQFYLRDMTVLKVMLGAVFVAAPLLVLFTNFGWLDMSLVWVNPTYLWPGTLGGFVMGLGFMIGGFCPGTSIVALATLKLDGIFFLIGVSIGILLFGETVSSLGSFWYSSSYGHLTLDQVFGIDKGIIILMLIGIGLFSFILAEMSERKFGEHDPTAKKVSILPRSALTWSAVVFLCLVGIITAAKGSPTAQDKWERVSYKYKPLLKTRAVFSDPREVTEITENTELYTVILDLRDEADYNLFHLKNSINVSMSDLKDPAFVKKLQARPSNTVFFTASWDEKAAIEGWKLLKGQNLLNLYILKGGINYWNKTYPPPACLCVPKKGLHKIDTSAYNYFRAVGNYFNSSYLVHSAKKLPSCLVSKKHESHHKHEGSKKPTFKHKVKMKKKHAVTGGCG